MEGAGGGRGAVERCWDFVKKCWELWRNIKTSSEVVDGRGWVRPVVLVALVVVVAVVVAPVVVWRQLGRRARNGGWK